MRHPRHRFVVLVCALPTIALSLTALAAPQAALWYAQEGAPFLDVPCGVTADGAGGAFMAGLTYQSVYGPNPFPGLEDVVVARIDANGQRVWGGSSAVPVPIHAGAHVRTAQVGSSSRESLRGHCLAPTWGSTTSGSPHWTLRATSDSGCNSARMARTAHSRSPPMAPAARFFAVNPTDRSGRRRRSRGGTDGSRASTRRASSSGSPRSRATDTTRSTRFARMARAASSSGASRMVSGVAPPARAATMPFSPVWTGTGPCSGHGRSAAPEWTPANRSRPAATVGSMPVDRQAARCSARGPVM